jgi:hypothetical protein
MTDYKMEELMDVPSFYWSRPVFMMALIFGPVALHAATVYAYVEAPTSQSSSVSGATTESFDELSAGDYSNSYTTSVSTAIGTYVGTPSNPFAIVPVDQYGGAGGTGNYFAVGAETGKFGRALLDLNSEANYFGFWWSAGDVNNSITLLQDGTALATFTTADLVALLPNSGGTTVMALNGVLYNTIDYYGNPNGLGDASEPFAYVDIVANGLQFNQVLFSQLRSAGFESDNHSVADGVTAPPPGDVLVQSLQLTPDAAPEPASWGLAFLGLGAILWNRARVALRA